MHIDFIDILRCPRTQSTLSLVDGQADARGVVMEGTLQAADGTRYKIVRGIPRFVDEEQYSHSFGVEWNRWPRLQFEDQNIDRPMAGHTTHMWEVITAARDEQVEGKTIVEFGCGPGRFLDVVRRKGGKAVGIDLSLAVEAARRNFKDDTDVLIVHGDILNPPFARDAFDGGYTIGVLHHTPDPAVGLQALADRIKPDGWIACCVYPKDEFYDYPSVLRWRKINRFAKRYVGYRLSLAYSYLAAYVLTEPMFALRRYLPKLADWLMKNWLPILAMKDRRWRVLDVFDAITPEYASTHTFDEVEGWMKQVHLTEIRHTPWCPTSFRGTVPQSQANPSDTATHDANA